MTGWCLEVVFTSMESILIHDWRLMGRTSLLMFPIYGCGALLAGRLAMKVLAPCWHPLADWQTCGSGTDH